MSSTHLREIIALGDPLKRARPRQARSLSLEWPRAAPGRSFQNVTVDAQRVYFESTSGDDSRVGAVDRANAWIAAATTAEK